MTAPRILLSGPDVGPAERSALLAAFDSGWIAPVGPDLDEFEAELADAVGWPGAVALSSGTAGLQLALVAVGVQPGDDVIVSDLTFVASANAVVHVGAHPVFVDSDASWNMSPDLLTAELAARAQRGRLPAAVMVVDLYGASAEMDRIVDACAEYRVAVVEDAAEALGSTFRGRPSGTLGDIGVFSFNGNKIVTTSGGGALVTPSVEVAERVRYLAAQARQPVEHYEHTEVGYNHRLSNLLAAVGRAQLARLPEMVERRLAINAAYRSALDGCDGVDFMPVSAHTTWNGWLSCITVHDAVVRQRVMRALDSAAIECRRIWKPMHLQPVFADAARRVDGTSADLFDRGLCLPSGSALTDAEVSRVIDTLLITLDT